jgi:hypothetical protein
MRRHCSYSLRLSVDGSFVGRTIRGIFGTIDPQSRRLSIGGLSSGQSLGLHPLSHQTRHVGSAVFRMLAPRLLATWSNPCWEAFGFAPKSSRLISCPNQHLASPTRTATFKRWWKPCSNSMNGKHRMTTVVPIQTLRAVQESGW